MLHKRQASAAFLIYKSVTSTKVSYELSKAKSQSRVSWDPNSAFHCSSICPHPPHLRLGSGGCIHGFGVSATYLVSWRRCGSGSPESWVLKILLLSGWKRWQMYSVLKGDTFWAESCPVLFSSLSWAFSDWEHRLQVAVNGSGAWGSCTSPAGLRRCNKSDWVLLQWRVSGWEEISKDLG